MVTPGLIPLSEKFHVDTGTVSSLIIGAITFWTATASFLVVSGAGIWGRRSFYVISIAILAVTNLIAYLAEVRIQRRKYQRLQRLDTPPLWHNR